MSFKIQSRSKYERVKNKNSKRRKAERALSQGGTRQSNGSNTDVIDLLVDIGEIRGKKTVKQQGKASGISFFLSFVFVYAKSCRCVWNRVYRSLPAGHG
jgi:hypothetical protein